jgi:hypothetical protein
MILYFDFAQNWRRYWKHKTIFLALACIITIVCGSAEAQSPTIKPQEATKEKPSKEAWQEDPIEFARLIMGADLSLQPSTNGVTSVPVSDSVRQKVIGAQVNWSVFKRSNPLGSGPATLAAIGITQSNQTTGVLLLMPRRVAGDTEVCDAPYRDLPLNGSIQIVGKISNFLAGIRPDGNRVVVVEMTDVPGCSGVSTPTDLSGNWNHERRGGRTIGVAFPASLVGVWDFELEVTHMVGRDGFVKKESRFFEWVVRFRQNGNKLTGDLVGGKGSRGEGVCADAAIEGTVNGRKVEFTVTYQGTCCYDEKMVFVGEIGTDDKSLTGKIEPVVVPTNYSCSLAYADTKGTKRENRRSQD